MPICKKCGVEIDAAAERCPLCGTSQNAESWDLTPNPVNEAVEEKVTSTHPWFLELFTFFAIAGFIIVFAVDFAYGANLTWSRLPLISIVFTWLFAFFIVHLKKKPYLLVSLETLDLIVFLWLMDRCLPAYSWFYNLALPVILVAGILFLLVILWIRSFRLSIFRALSVGTLSVGVFLLCLEFILNRFHGLPVFISWSLVAFACILLVSALFLYLERKFNKNNLHWKKYFRV
ncbi:MAG TPA: DUF6320 domain-containing protein [Candidatus Cloacimonadota bacterium]|nr:DUF6320 domain-containing protein [Candidatus Cloacimonadota bacterium]